MKTCFSRVLVTLLTLSLGIAVSIWWRTRSYRTSPAAANLTRSVPEDRDDAIEIVFRDLMRRYEVHPLYFLSYGESDPSDQFMARFNGTNASIKKLSEAARNYNQVLDRQSGKVGVRLDAGLYYPVNDNEVRIGATWEFSERLGKDPKWTIWPSEYELQKVNGKWVIKSYKVVPPIP